MLSSLLVLALLVPSASAFSVNLLGGAAYVEADQRPADQGYQGALVSGVVGSNVAPVNTTYLAGCEAATPNSVAIGLCLLYTDGMVNGQRVRVLVACLDGAAAAPQVIALNLCPLSYVLIGDPNSPTGAVLFDIVVAQQDKNGTIESGGCEEDAVVQGHDFTPYACQNAFVDASCASTDSWTVSPGDQHGNDTSSRSCASSTGDGSTGECATQSISGSARSACAGALLTQSSNSICAYAESGVDQPPSQTQIFCIGTAATRANGFGPTASVLGEAVLP